jgi:hypothetical protein
MVIGFETPLRVEAKRIFKCLGARKLAVSRKREGIYECERILVLVFLEIYHWTKSV